MIVPTLNVPIIPTQSAQSVGMISMGTIKYYQIGNV